MLRLRKVLLALVCLSCALSVSGQVATGLYNYGSFDSFGFDSIDRGSLNVHFAVPIVAKSGRAGLNFQYTLAYDGLIWTPTSSSGSGAWTPDASFGLHGYLLDDGYRGYLSYRYTLKKCAQDGSTNQDPYYFGYIYHDPFGANHSFSYTRDTCTGVTTGNGSSNDGSGFTYDINTGEVLAKDGTHLNLPLSVNGLTSGTDSTITDTNGNEISNDGSGVFTDTTGAKALTITGSGTASSAKVFKYLTYGSNPNNTTPASANITVSYKTYTVQTNFGCSGVTEYNQSVDLVDKITFADGSYYQFLYEATPGVTGHVTGRLASIQLPTGGTIQYAYTGADNGINCADGTPEGVTRTTSDGSRTYVRSLITTTSSHTDIADGSSNHSTYDFVTSGSPTTFYETTEAHYQGAVSGTLLQQETICYSSTTCPSTAITAPITTLVTSTTQNGVAIDTDTRTYSGGFLLSDDDGYVKTVDSYQTFTGANSVGFARLSGQTVSLYNGSTLKQVAQTTYGFDQTTPKTTGGIPQHAAETTSRGNVTTITPWLNTTNAAFAPTTIQYYDTGVPETSATTSGTSTYSYEATQSYLTGFTPPTPSSGVALSMGGTSDPNSGLPLTATDPNSNTTTYKTYDEMLRPLEIDLPNGGKQTFDYPSAYSGGSYTYITGSTATNSQTLYDGYGRLSRTAVFNGQGSNSWYQQDYCYDVNGRLSFQSTPYLGTGFGVAPVCSGAGDKTTYDALGRVLEVLHGDNTHINYTYSGLATEIVDEHGVTRINQVDGHGRLVSVCEVSSASLQGVAPVNCGLNIGGTGFLTTYAYAAGSTGNQITTITQGAQTRIFQTDSLGRTVSTQEPEELISTGQGVTTYSYAYSGANLIVTRKRPKANQESPTTLTTTTSTYDALGRLIGVSYDDGLTPSKAYYYDSSNWAEGSSQANLKGHLSLANTGSGSTQFTGTLYSYDQIGDTKAMWECQPSGCGTSSRDRALSFGYDLAGRLTSETEAVTGTVNFGLSPAGEVTSIGSTYYNATNPESLVSNVSNSVAGPTLYTLGNGLTTVNTYDSLLNISGGYVCNGSSSISCNGGTQLYGYTSARNAGRVFGGCDTVLSVCQNFGYDGFGRLASRTVTSGTTQNFTYGYDRYGNRWQQNVTAGSGPQPQLSFDAGNHVVGSGTEYDAAGNMVLDGLGNTYKYDAEGNVLSVSGSNTATYVYDALNQKVSAVTSAGTSEYTYDYLGRRLETWVPSANQASQVQVYWGTGKPFAYRASDGSTYFQHDDWLGTQRALTSYTGASAGTYQSLPFGDGFTSSGRNDNLTHFAGQDQSAVSGVIQAMFRSMSTTDGRWMSPDPYSGSYELTNPQSFNRYSYALNNPISNIDPSGLDCTSAVDPQSGQTITTCTVDGNPPASPQPWQCVEYGGCNWDPWDWGTDQPLPPPPPSTPPTGPAPSKITCGTKLPNGQTVGQVINQGRAQLQAIVDAQNAIAQSGGDVNDLRLTGSFGYFVRPGGPTDFKNLFRGQANGAFLGQAGNFAYYAIGSGYLPNSELDAGAGAYALIFAALGKKPFSSLTGPMFSDASAASQRNAGLATPGCPN